MLRVSKWDKYIFLKNNEEVERHLPKTINFSSQEELWDFVKEHHTVVIKPRSGNKGKSIFKITALESDEIEIHYLNRKRKFSNKDSAFAYLQKAKAPKHYIAQSYIPLANIQGYPFDIRVVVQRPINANEWVVTGKVAKLAGNGFFVTNTALSRGSLLPIAEAIKASNIHTSDENSEKLISELERITLLAVKSLEELNPGHRIYGFDIGIDSDGYIWIIEANVYPALSHFSKLQDKTMYHKIRKMLGGNRGKIRKIKKLRRRKK
ncbi:YheC/YheD family protein [Neobacillus kokaensis]|uniref:ATP-grasp domain-containing protein n=1 Tax=Neobacillus kokaensis TaxID=2759023 RepID=A0ABQ3N760_9BACI|nr:YheC/YheD family protein [Neobacillus kokaensis]GHH99690.1 hypothetical protein AM1BK_32330 [Neobacillus kokaensis]